MKLIAEIASDAAKLVCMLAPLAIGLAVYAPNADAQSPVVIDGDMGGVLADYALRAGQYRRDNRRVEILGACGSACTVFIGLPGACIGPHASVLMHAAYERGTGKTLPWATAMIVASYPLKLQQWVAAHGGLTAEIMTLGPDDMRGILPECGRKA